MEKTKELRFRESVISMWERAESLGVIKIILIIKQGLPRVEKLRAACEKAGKDQKIPFFREKEWLEGVCSAHDTLSKHFIYGNVEISKVCDAAREIEHFTEVYIKTPSKIWAISETSAFDKEFLGKIKDLP